MRSSLASLLALTIALFAVLGSAQGPPRRTAYESKCGSEIKWLDDLESAKAAAKETGKPVLWFVPHAFGSKMDRIQELYWYSMGGMFSDPETVAMINDRFVPLRFGFASWQPGLKPKALETMKRAELKELAEKYMVKNISFIEPGILLLDKDMNVVVALDRLTTFNSKWFRARVAALTASRPRLGKAFNAEDYDQKRGEPLKAAHALLAKSDVVAAETAFEKAAAGADRAEARYFLGVTLHMQRKTAAGDRIWTELANDSPDHRFGAKAKLELERWGPFIHGFEEYRDYPQRALGADAPGTAMPSKQENIEEMARRAVDVILALQRENGSWDDSRYDFGGLDSLPNVHVAVTALACLALLEWRAVAPERIDAALLAAAPYLADEKSTAPDDQDELIWAHVYRMLYFQRVAEASPNDAPTVKKKMQQVVHQIEAVQQKGGDWRHEYPNPFAGASVLHVLAIAKDLGLKVDGAKIKSGTDALARCRTQDGVYTYGSTRGSARSVPLPFGAGRAPLCELALYLHGKSDKQKLEKALELGFEHHKALESIRKYDDHADQYGNGGFFFWYDMLGRSEALKRYDGPKAREWRQALRSLVLDIHEVDGSWIDSHELGKTYGTAMGLIVLKQNLDPKQ